MKRAWRSRSAQILLLTMLPLLGSCGDDPASPPETPEKSWHALPGCGVSTVLSMCVGDGNLYVGGGWDTEPTDFVARWNGSSWTSLATGGALGLRSIVLYQGLPVAGGWFEEIGGVAASYLAMLGEEGWRGISGGTNGPVECLAVRGADLFVAGCFDSAGGMRVNQIVRWDGEELQPLGAGLNCIVDALVVHDDSLVAGGRFTSSGEAPLRRIGRWDGSLWTDVGGGFNDGVYAFTIYNGDLIAGGCFTEAGGLNVNYVARWDGSSWNALGAGLDGGSGLDPGVRALAVYEGRLIAGGIFTRSGDAMISNLAVWDGSSWRPFGGGVSGGVSALAIFGDDLLVSGWFTAAGSTPANGLVRWGE